MKDLVEIVNYGRRCGKTKLLKTIFLNLGDKMRQKKLLLNQKRQKNFITTTATKECSGVENSNTKLIIKKDSKKPVIVKLGKTKAIKNLSMRKKISKKTK